MRSSSGRLSPGGARALLGACACLACLTVGAQTAEELGRKPQVCPLSEEQTQKSIDAFSKLVPTFQHPRCINCHGVVDPHAPEETTKHGGGDIGDQACKECHSEVMGGSQWMLPIRDHFFVGKDAKTLCEQMTDNFHARSSFINHLQDDNLIGVAFLGTRALKPTDPDAANMTHDLPPVSRAEFVRLANAWLDAMGGDFVGERDCGCEPLHYALRISYKSQVKMGVVSSTETMGPIDIPITFHDDRSFEGERTVYFAGNAVAYTCTAASTGSMDLKVSGNVTGELPHERMSLKMENTSPLKGKVAAVCPGQGKTANLDRGQSASLDKDVLASVGEHAHFTPSAGVPGMTTVIDAEIVQIH